MRTKYLLAFLVVAVVALTGVGCADLVSRRTDRDPGGPAATTPTPTPTPTPSRQPSREAGTSHREEKLSQPDLIAKVKPSVVRLVGSDGGGSGVVIDAGQGLVLTNAHVTFGQQGLRAQVGDDPASQTAAQLVAAAPCDDLAVVRLLNKPANLKAIRFGDSSTVRPGDHVTALGYPTSLEEQRAGDTTTQAHQLIPTDGNVSAVDVVTDGSPDLPRYASTIQHQAPINPGNSGGPLVDDRGRLVGINSLRNAETQGQNYAVSVNRVRQVLPSLVAGQSQASLGWDLTSLATADLPAIFAADPDLTAHGGAELGQRVLDRLAQDQIDGLYVRETERGSAVEAATIFSGNLVTRIDGRPVRTEQDVCNLVLPKRSGDTVQVDGYFLYSADAAEALQPWSVEVTVA
jgi:S1-C subfamily serine protease